MSTNDKNFVRTNRGVIRIPGGSKLRKREKEEKEARNKEPMWAGCKKEMGKFGVTEPSGGLPIGKPLTAEERERTRHQGGFGHIAGASGGAALIKTRNDGRNRKMQCF